MKKNVSESPLRMSIAPRPRRAFTLIELLTVIAIIGVLAGILIPVVGKVRRNARLASSASNLRQIGNAMFLYAGDNRDRLPGAGQNTVFIIDSTLELSNNNRLMHRDLSRYLGDRAEVWRSPADEAFYHIYHNGTATSYAHALGDFVVNEGGGTTFSTPSRTLTEFQRMSDRPPSRRPIFAEADWEIALPATTNASGAPVNDRFNVCFLDGHVARYLRTTTQGRYRNNW